MYEDVTKLGWFRGNPATARMQWGFAGFGLTALGIVVTWVTGAAGPWALIPLPIALVGFMVIATIRIAPARKAEGTRILAQTQGFELFLSQADGNKLPLRGGQRHLQPLPPVRDRVRRRGQVVGDLREARRAGAPARRADVVRRPRLRHVLVYPDELRIHDEQLRVVRGDRPERADARVQRGIGLRRRRRRRRRRRWRWRRRRLVGNVTVARRPCPGGGPPGRMGGHNSIGDDRFRRVSFHQVKRAEDAGLSRQRPPQTNRCQFKPHRLLPRRLGEPSSPSAQACSRPGPWRHLGNLLSPLVIGGFGTLR